MARTARKVAWLGGLLLLGCGGKTIDSSGSGANGGESANGGSGEGGSGQGGTGQGGTPPSGQGGSQPGFGGGVSDGGMGGFGGVGGAPECVDGEENTCDCGGFSQCLHGTWGPCDCPQAACDNDSFQVLETYAKCGRNDCIPKLSTPDYTPCIQDCVNYQTGVSEGCSGCIAELIECMATTCISACLSDKDGSCNRCICDQGCLQRARACAGNNTDLPVCADGT